MIDGVSFTHQIIIIRPRDANPSSQMSLADIFRDGRASAIALSSKITAIFNYPLFSWFMCAFLLSISPTKTFSFRKRIVRECVCVWCAQGPFRPGNFVAVVFTTSKWQIELTRFAYRSGVIGMERRLNEPETIIAHKSETEKKTIQFIRLLLLFFIILFRCRQGGGVIEHARKFIVCWGNRISNEIAEISGHLIRIFIFLLWFSGSSGAQKILIMRNIVRRLAIVNLMRYASNVVCVCAWNAYMSRHCACAIGAK